MSKCHHDERARKKTKTENIRMVGVLKRNEVNLPTRIAEVNTSASATPLDCVLLEANCSTVADKSSIKFTSLGLKFKTIRTALQTRAASIGIHSGKLSKSNIMTLIQGIRSK